MGSMIRQFNSQLDVHHRRIEELRNTMYVFNTLPLAVRVLEADYTYVREGVYPGLTWEYSGDDADERASEAVRVLMQSGFDFTPDYVLAMDHQPDGWKRIGEMTLGDGTKVQVIVDGFSTPIGYHAVPLKSHVSTRYESKCDFKHAGVANG